MAGILTYTLEDEGFMVTVARDGIQALGLAVLTTIPLSLRLNAPILGDPARAR